MNRTDLERELDLLGVNTYRYSLYGELNPDTMILYQNYNKWEVFYLDERGGRETKGVFDSEAEACDYLINYFRKARQIEIKYGLNS